MYMRQSVIHINNMFYKQIQKNFIHKNKFAVFNIIIKQKNIEIIS